MSNKENHYTSPTNTPETSKQSVVLTSVSAILLLLLSTGLSSQIIKTIKEKKLASLKTELQEMMKNKESVENYSAAIRDRRIHHIQEEGDDSQETRDKREAKADTLNSIKALQREIKYTIHN